MRLHSIVCVATVAIILVVMLLISSLVLVILNAATIIEGGILLQQFELLTSGMAVPWTVEGVATYIHGVNNNRNFFFRCTSTINNGYGLTWTKKGGDFSKTQMPTPGGVDLDFGSNPSASDAGVYVCRDSNSNDIKELNITDSNPAAYPVHSGVLQTIIGETVAIEFYASGIPRTQSGNYTWWHNNTLITSGMFEKDKRRLMILSSQEADSGQYQFRVLLQLSASMQLSTFASVNVVVTAPFQITQELPTVIMATEWSNVTLTCTVNSTFSLNIVWRKVGGALPPNQQLYSNKGVATLTLLDVRYADIGEYYFSVSYTSQTTSIIHQATTSTQLSIIPVLGLRLNNTPLNQFLYQAVGSMFNITCLASGSLNWSGPDGISISSSSSSSVYQTSGSLHVYYFNANSNGVYTCNSSLGLTESVMITNKNPSVHSSVTSHRVGINAIAALKVYVGGSDPVPSPHHIQWFKNGSTITTQTSQYYTLSVDNTQLTINASTKNVAGVYECRVTTIQGQASSFITVTLPDPPILRVEPSNKTVLTGNSASFECLVNGTLPHTIQWLFGSSSILPLGVSVLGSTLVINSTNRTHTGSYVCVVSDGLNVVMATSMLLVKSPPTAGIGYTTHFLQSMLTISFDVFAIPAMIICSSDGYPTPSLTWMFNGDPLPDGVIQAKIEPSNGLGHAVQLLWLRELSYNDNGTYMCVAQNEVDSSTAILNILITAKPKISSIYPAMANMLIVKTNSTFATFLSQKNAVTLICVGHGLPSPNLEWQTTSGVKLNASFTTHSDGVVSAVLTMNKHFSSTAVQCVAVSNETRIDIQTVRIEEATDLVVQETMEAPYTKFNAIFVIRLLRKFSYIHCDNQSASLQILQQEMNFILHHVVISRISHVTNNIITIDTISCSREVTGAVVIKGNIREHVFRSLDEWRRTGPIVFINNTWATLDQNCSLLAPADSNQECIETMHTTTSSFLNSATFYALVGLFFCFVLTVFTTTGVLIFFCWKRLKPGVAVPQESNTSNNPVRTLENYVTQNVDHTHQIHEESEEVIYDEVLTLDLHQSFELARMKTYLAYASIQMPAEQQPAGDQIHTKECLAYASSQRPVVDQITMKECPAYNLSPVNDQMV